MTKPTMTSQWDPGNFKPLDMSKILGYPRQMPPKYKKWLPRFTGSDGERVNNHMSNFWAFFQLHPISDDAKDLVMKLFSATLYGNDREWYDNLPNVSITTMEQLEETFLKRWGFQLEDVQALLKELEYAKQTEDETVRHFQDRFEHILYQIPKSHRPKDKYIVHLYTHALLVHLGFPLTKRGPRTLNEAHSMAARIEQNISLSEIRYLFTSGTLSMESLVALENFIVDFQEEGEQTIDQHRTTENTVEELEPEENEEVSMSPPPDEAVHESFSPAQEETNTVSYPTLQNFDDFLLYDLGNEEKMEEPLNVLNTPCYDTDTDIVDIDEFIHVGRLKWDVVGYDMEPIYDIENHFQVLPSQLSQHVTLDFD
jgi:hypothetical protein